MAQFDVVENPSAKSKSAIPLLLVLQHDRVSETASVIVAGLAPVSKARTMSKSRLYPVLHVNEREYVLLTPNMAAVPRRLLGRCVGSLEPEQRRIIDALDMLFTGA